MLPVESKILMQLAIFAVCLCALYRCSLKQHCIFHGLDHGGEHTINHCHGFHAA